jgi:hypothetical protein
MPRRNNTKRRPRPIPAEKPVIISQSYLQMARSLVERGLRPAAILDRGQQNPHTQRGN